MQTLLLAAALAGPARAADVEVMPVGLREVHLSKAGLEAELLLEVERTGGPGMRLRALDYRLELDGEPVAEATAKYGGMRLPKGEQVLVSVPVRIDPVRATELAWRGATQGRLSLSFQGKAKVWWLVFPVSVPFHEQLVDVDLD